MQRSAKADEAITIEGSNMSKQSTKVRGSFFDRSLWRRGLSLLTPRERRTAWIVLGIVILSAISAAVMVGSVVPFLTVFSDPSRIESVPQLAWAYERFGFSSQYQFIVVLGLITIAMIVVANAIQMLRVYAVSRFTMLRVHSISHRLLERYLHQPYEFFLAAHSSDLSSRILDESTQVVQYFLRPAAEVISAVITLAMVLAVVIWVDPVVAIMSILVLGAVFALALLASSRKMTILGEVRKTANKARYRVAGEALSGIKDIKLLGSERIFLSRFDGHSLKMALSNVGKNVLTQLPPYVIQTLVFSGIILLCLLMLDSGAENPERVMAELVPTLGVMALAAQRLMPELSRLFANVGLLRYGRAAVDSVYEGLYVGSAVPAGSETQEAPLSLRSELVLDNIGYRYPNAEIAGLEAITLQIRAGERIGVVGTSGAGKTTLADILLGLLRPEVGEIRADGIPITSDRLPAWRRTVGYVPQEIYLLDASVAENIAFGVSPAKIDRARVEAAARLAQLDAFVSKELPQGYDTPVGERGLRLSGGQRQRIGIARALYREADLVVFDEATSALDNVTEQEVMAATDALPGDKTVVIIAHRLSTVRRCDRILVLEKGRVAGFDTWERLNATNPAFQALTALDKEA
ncbi:MAG: ABC transporter ATP-binding protein [Ruegeria sp.]|nr:ABC transporter ATP-binding protein [Ruegeria sp.]